MSLGIVDYGIRLKICRGRASTNVFVFTRLEDRRIDHPDGGERIDDVMEWLRPPALPSARQDRLTDPIRWISFREFILQRMEEELRKSRLRYP
jgi:hypothetical protein